jgi:hypothetical protein
MMELTRRLITILVAATLFVLWMFITALATPAQTDGSSAVSQTEPVLPLRPTPVHRALSLNAIESSIRQTIADSLQESQVGELKNAVEDPAKKNLHFLKGLALALEQYRDLELSFPDSISQLKESGYWLDGWADIGITVIDYLPQTSISNDNVIYYIPQPVGLNKLIRDPTQFCGYRLRCYSEYALLVPATQKASWIVNDKEMNNDWIEPFLKLGLIEIYFVSMDDPTKSGCSTCSKE